MPSTGPKLLCRAATEAILSGTVLECANTNCSHGEPHDETPDFCRDILTSDDLCECLPVTDLRIYARMKKEEINEQAKT